MGKWTDLTHGDILAAEQRLWCALGDDASAVIEKIKTDPAYVVDVAAYAVRQLKSQLTISVISKVSDIVVCKILGKPWIFAEAVRALPGIGQTSDIATLGRSLNAWNYTISGEEARDTARTARLTAFFFSETGDENSPVSVGEAFADGFDCRADIYQLDCGISWRPGVQLLLRDVAGILRP